MFNPTPKLGKLSFGEGVCFVVDDALQDPGALRDFAAGQRARFAQAPFNAYPGIEMGLTGPIENALGEFFDRHLRSLLGGRRRVRMNCRLAMTTTPPDELQPRQCIPHRDSAWIQPQHVACASVLYLFDDPALGGTSFYRPRQDANATARLVHDSSTLAANEFGAKYGIGATYPSGTTRYFEHLASVPARFNRMIFYDGRLFHSGDIHDARALGDDPRTGRLTLNGFYTCTAKAGA
jgi:hypothetical protein